MEVIDIHSKRGLRDSPNLKILGSDVLKIYNNKIISYGLKARRSLNVLFSFQGHLAGGNYFTPLVLRDCIPRRSRLADMIDFRENIGDFPNFLSGFDVNSGIILAGNEDSFYKNDLLAEYLANQLNCIGAKVDDNPFLIYFDALDLKEDEDSEYGLVYVLNERARIGRNIFETSSLRVKNDLGGFSRLDERGIPIIDPEGERILRVRKGISKFNLYNGFNVGCKIESLNFSSGNERTVIVESEESERVADVIYLDDYI